jgi:hypothetical protein
MWRDPFNNETAVTERQPLLAVMPERGFSTSLRRRLGRDQIVATRWAGDISVVAVFGGVVDSPELEINKFVGASGVRGDVYVAQQAYHSGSQRVIAGGNAAASGSS